MKTKSDKNTAQLLKLVRKLNTSNLTVALTWYLLAVSIIERSDIDLLVPLLIKSLNSSLKKNGALR